jgi:hypothetical protein
MGYLGRLRWRVRTSDGCVDVPDVSTAVKLVFDAVFRDVQKGHEAAARSPLELEILDVRRRLLAEPTFMNGWRCSSPLSEATVGDHALLLPFVVEHVASAAEDVWAVGVERIHPPSLRARFSFTAFAEARSPESLCRDLEAALNERLRDHPSPAAAFELAMKELKAAGHDLWSWTPEEVWGRDYLTDRRGAGLLVTRYTDDAEEGVANTVKAEFAPPT